MKQIMTIWVLLFGICSVSVNAQTKEYIVEDDGFEWYKTGSIKNGALDKQGNAILPEVFGSITYDKGIFRVRKDNALKYGAYDLNGNLLIPIEYDYLSKEEFGIYVKKDEYEGYYNENGKCIIPISRKYMYVRHYGNYIECHSSKLLEKGRIFLCDTSGRIVFKTLDDCESVHIVCDKPKNKYAIIIDGKYFVDKEGNIVLDPHCFYIDWKSDGGINDIRIRKTRDGQKRVLSQAEKQKVIFSGNIFSSSDKKDESHPTQAKVSPNTTKPNKQTADKENRQDGEQKIIIEHHHDPVPVQEWVQCTACWGSTVCPHCAGSGTVYIGSNLHRCSRCSGRKICTSCSGKGGRYITVYK